MPSRPRDDGLSEVVGFVLLLGLIVVALSLYQVYGVPAAGREDEIAHMNAVKDRFVDYKIALDSLWVNGRNGVLLSTAFELGTGSAATGGRAFAFPILTPAGSGGTVSVKSGGANLTIAPEGKDPVTIPLGSLTYTSSNNYWVEQTWTYQGGAVFLSQEGGTTVRVGPSIAVAKSGTGNINLDVALTRLEGSGISSGSGPVRVETRMRWSESSSLSGTYHRVNLTVEADDELTAGAWKRAFDDVRGRAKEDYEIMLSEPVLSDDGKTVTFTVNPGTGKTISLTMHQARYTVTIYNAASLAE